MEIKSPANKTLSLSQKCIKKITPDTVFHVTTASNLTELKVTGPFLAYDAGKWKYRKYTLLLLKYKSEYKNKTQ